MNNRRFVSLVFLGTWAAGLLLAACAPLTPPPTEGLPVDVPAGKLPAGTAPSLMGTRWNLTGYGPLDALIAPAAPATLDIDGERFSGTTGCNGYSAVYQTLDEQLKFLPPGPMLTMMACPDAQMQQETEFLKILNAVDHYLMEPERLTLSGPAGALVFAAAQAAALEGPVWQLSGLAQNDAMVNAAGDEQITLTFKAGQAEGFGGCNSYFGAYTLAADQLTVGPMGATRMFCEGEPGQRETAYLEALAKTAAYQITRSTLTLLGAEGQVLMQLTARE